MKKLTYYGIFEYIPAKEGDMKRLVVMRESKEFCEIILKALEQTNVLFDSYKIETMYIDKPYSYTWEKA